VVTPDDPALNPTCAKSVGPGIAPFSIDHKYVDPLPAQRGTAILPTEFGQSSVMPGPSARAPAGYAAIGLSGGASIATVFVALVENPQCVIVKPRTTEPDGPAEYVIDGVPLALVSAPFSIVQSYVAPARTKAADALLFVEFAHAVDGDAMVASGGVFTGMTTDDAPLIPQRATVTEIVIGPAGPAVNVAKFADADDVSVPFVTLHANVAPAPGLGVIARKEAPGHTPFITKPSGESPVALIAG
jgi:hypothetical protein